MKAQDKTLQVMIENAIMNDDKMFNKLKKGIEEAIDTYIEEGGLEEQVRSSFEYNLVFDSLVDSINKQLQKFKVKIEAGVE